MDQFDCADRALWILWINVDEHDLGPQILDLPQDGIRWADRETDTAKDSSAQVGALQSVLEHGHLVPVFAEDGNPYAMHVWVLTRILRYLHGIGEKYS